MRSINWTKQVIKNKDGNNIAERWHREGTWRISGGEIGVNIIMFICVTCIKLSKIQTNVRKQNNKNKEEVNRRRHKIESTYKIDNINKDIVIYGIIKISDKEQVHKLIK